MCRTTGTLKWAHITVLAHFISEHFDKLRVESHYYASNVVFVVLLANARRPPTTTKVPLAIMNNLKAQ